MKKRMVIMLIGVGILLGGIIGFNGFKGYMMKKYMASAPVPPATVSAMTADLQDWQPQLQAVGSLRAFRGVDVTDKESEQRQTQGYKEQAVHGRRTPLRRPWKAGYSGPGRRCSLD